MDWSLHIFDATDFPTDALYLHGMLLSMAFGGVVGVSFMGMIVVSSCAYVGIPGPYRYVSYVTMYNCITPTAPPSAALETATPLFVAKTGWLSGMPSTSKYQCFLTDRNSQPVQE